MSTSLALRLGGLSAVFALALGAVAAPAADAADERHFQRVATMPVHLNNDDQSAETVAEISTVTPDGNTVIHTDAAMEQLGFVNITDPAHPKPDGTVKLDGEPTSVYATGQWVLAVINTSASYVETSGEMVVISLANRQVVSRVQLGGQPDSIDVNPAGTQAVIAIENERDEDLGDGGLPQAPAGYVTVIDLTGEPSDWKAQPVDMSALASVNGIVATDDLEPEYVKYSPDGTRIAVTMQENNGVAIVDAATLAVSGFSAGTVNLDFVDTAKDKQINPTASLTDVPREPDAIAWIGNDHVATANEGDWKGGSRGWTVFGLDGTVTWDAGNSFEHLAIQHGQWPEHRAAKKGTEPEGIAVATYGDTTYAFVASERGNFVAVYNVNDPAQPVFRDFLPVTPGPEGLLPIPSRDLMVVSSEVDDAKDGIRATVSVFQLAEGKANTPSLKSRVRTRCHQGTFVDIPDSWGALSGLSMVPGKCGRLMAVSDSALQPTRTHMIDTTTDVPTISTGWMLRKHGIPMSIDAEGIVAVADGTFWIAGEGKSGEGNALYHFSRWNTLIQQINVPAEAAADMTKNGFEGVTAMPDGRLVVAVQRMKKLGDEATRLAIVDPATRAWTWLEYPLESTDTKGDWIGLSEVTMVDANTVAVIERDKLSGPQAALKAVYTVDIPAKGGTWTAPVAVSKKLAVDVLPALRASNGWTQEKLEGLAIGSDGHLWAVTDNDLTDDASGETMLMDLGKATELFPGQDITIPGCR